jgi:hypothetical protein
MVDQDEAVLCCAAQIWNRIWNLECLSCTALPQGVSAVIAIKKGAASVMVLT